MAPRSRFLAATLLLLAGAPAPGIRAQAALPPPGPRPAPPCPTPRALDSLLARAAAAASSTSPALRRCAVALGERAAADAERAGRARDAGTAHNRLAVVHAEAGRFDRALAAAARAERLLRSAGDSAGLADALFNAGAAHLNLDRYDSALVAFSAAGAVARARGDRLGEAAALNGAGDMYRTLGRPDSALHHFALAHRTALAAGDTLTASDALNNMGLVHQELGSAARTAADRAQLDTARRRLEASLALLGRDPPPDMLAPTLGNLGVVERRLYRLDRDPARLDSAIRRYRRALALEQAMGDGRAAARTLHNVALVRADQGDARRAREGLRDALGRHRAYRDAYWEGMAHAELARTWRTLAPRDPARAAAHYDSAARVFARIAARAGGDANRLGFGEQRMVLGVFEEWALAELAAGGPRSAVRALDAAERGRAQALLQLMGGGRTAGGAAPPPRAGAALSYLVTDDTLVVWVADAAGVTAARRAVPRDSVAALVEAARERLGAASLARGLGVGSRRPPRADSLALDRLAALLVPAELRPALARHARVTVVPHGVLGLVPFAALPVDGAPLGAARAVRYAPSLATLAAAERLAAGDADARRQGARALVVGDPAMPPVPRAEGGAATLPALPGAAVEGTWVAHRLGAALLGGGAASEAAVRRLLPGAPLVHLATHGLAYATDAETRRSFVALAPGGGEDGLLTVAEVLDALPPLRASLVVLSACQTALGNLTQAEGTVGLQRAFLARGARSVLVSLWSVSDEATALLMRRFYTHWLDDPDRPGKAEALRRAQADVRATPGFESPTYWAAFQLVGAD